MVNIEQSIGKSIKEGFGAAKSVNKALRTSRREKLVDTFGKEIVNIFFTRPRGVVKR